MSGEAGRAEIVFGKRSVRATGSGRLISASNPETGNGTNGNVIQYWHDANGNVNKKLDAKGITTFYGYDSLNRLRAKLYSDSTPWPIWCYDGDANSESYSSRTITVSWNCNGAPTAATALSTRLTMTNAGTTNVKYSSYDELGEVLASQQTTNGSTYSYAVGKWYPSVHLMSQQTNATTGRTVTFTPDPANGLRVNCVSGSTAAGSIYYGYVSKFFGSGAPDTLQQGTAGCSGAQTGFRTATAVYDARLRPKTLTYSSGGSTLESLGYTWDNNGNLLSETIANNVNSAISLTQDFTGGYDGVNRLIQATEGAWTQKFGYDPYGNRTLFNSSTLPHAVVTPTADMPGGFTLGQNFDGGPYNARNQISSVGMTYDSAGNQSTAAGTITTATATYDAENRLTTDHDSSPTSQTQFPVTYYYDADGRRVMKAWCSTGTTCDKTSPNVNLTIYVYDAAGELSMEVGPAPPVNGTEYLFTDHLGSTRLMVEKQTGTTHCYDYAPFGEELGQGVNSRGNCYEALAYPSGTLGSVPDKFTGKERDAETGLDYFGARYLSSAFGRFTSADRPFQDQHVDNPQSWNLYSYVRNNPLSMVDLTGRDAVLLSDKKSGSTTLVIPVQLTGEGATPENINAIVDRGNSIDTMDSGVAVTILVTDKPFDGVLNHMDFSPGLVNHLVDNVTI